LNISQNICAHSGLQRINLQYRCFDFLTETGHKRLVLPFNFL